MKLDCLLNLLNESVPAQKNYAFLLLELYI